MPANHKQVGLYFPMLAKCRGFTGIHEGYQTPSYSEASAGGLAPFYFGRSYTTINAHSSTPGVYGAGCAGPSPWGLEKPVSQALARPPGEMKVGGTPPSATETALARGVDAGLSSVKLTDALLVITCPFTLLASLAGT